MARSIWRGLISFGLVSIPVELFPAEEKKEFKLSMLDKRDLSPVGYKRYSKSSGKEVPWSEIVKGYEYEKEHYVVLSDEDFRRANVKASKTIEIQEFVDEQDLSPEYFETPYYLVPEESGIKVYALLRETLRSSGRIGIAQFVLRSTQHLVAVKPVGRALMLIMLRYTDELRGTSGFELPPANLKEAKVSAKEIDLAKRLIDDMTDKWNPQDFKDTYHEDLMKRINEKIEKGETQKITQPAAEEGEEIPSAKIIDLAALLQKSLRGETRRAPERAREMREKPAPMRAHAEPKARATKTQTKRKRA